MKITHYWAGIAVSLLAGIAGAAFIAMWIVGDYSAPLEMVEPGYVPVTRPVPEAVIPAAAMLGAFGLVVAGIAVRGYPSAYLVLLLSIGVGAGLGFAYRTTDVDVLGANIGEGMGLLIALPFAACCAILAMVTAAVARPKRQPLAVRP